MLSIVGIIFGLACIFGSYIVGGGSMAPIWHALPLEGTAIAGAAIGAMLTANSMPIVKATVAGLGKILSGPSFKKQDYMDTIFLVAKLMKVLKAEGAVAVATGVYSCEQLRPAAPDHLFETLVATGDVIQRLLTKC